MSSVKNLIFVSGQRGLPKLIHKGYSFVRNKGNNQSTYWRCSAMKSGKCKARVITSENDNRITPNSPLHNHAPDYLQFMEAYY